MDDVLTCDGLLVGELAVPRTAPMLPVAHKLAGQSTWQAVQG